MESSGSGPGFNMHQFFKPMSGPPPVNSAGQHMPPPQFQGPVFHGPPSHFYPPFPPPGTQPYHVAPFAPPRPDFNPAEAPPHASPASVVPGSASPPAPGNLLDGANLMALLNAQSSADRSSDSNGVSSVAEALAASSLGADAESQGGRIAREDSNPPPALSPAQPSAPPAPAAFVASHETSALTQLQTGGSSKNRAAGANLSNPNEVYDVEAAGESKVTQLEVTPITVYGSEQLVAAGRQIAVNRSYICYALRAATIRILNVHTALRALLRGHSQRVTDMVLFGEDVHLLASASADGRVLVRKIHEEPGADGKLRITEQVLASLQLQAPGGAQLPYLLLCWHPRTQDHLVVACGKHVLLVSVSKVGGRDDAPVLYDVERPPPAGSGVRSLRGHSGDVTSLVAPSFSPSSLLATPSQDGTVRVWSTEAAEGEEACLSALLPHAGGAVQGAAFLLPPGGAPHQAVLLTGGAMNSELKLWRPLQADADAAAPPSPSGNWVCVQTVELRCGQVAAGEAFFNALQWVEAASLLLLANARRNHVYAFHLAFGDSPARARFDRVAQFAVTMPILSFTAMLAGPQRVHLYCVQPSAIQQYSLDVSQCLPTPAPASGAGSAPPLASSGSAALQEEAASGDGFASSSVAGAEVGGAAVAAPAGAAGLAASGTLSTHQAPPPSAGHDGGDSAETSTPPVAPGSALAPSLEQQPAGEVEGRGELSSVPAPDATPAAAAAAAVEAETKTEAESEGTLEVQAGASDTAAPPAAAAAGPGAEGPGRGEEDSEAARRAADQKGPLAAASLDESTASSAGAAPGTAEVAAAPSVAGSPNAAPAGGEAEEARDGPSGVSDAQSAAAAAAVPEAPAAPPPAPASPATATSSPPAPPPSAAAAAAPAPASGQATGKPDQEGTPAQNASGGKSGGGPALAAAAAAAAGAAAAAARSRKNKNKALASGSGRAGDAAESGGGGGSTTAAGAAVPSPAAPAPAGASAASGVQAPLPAEALGPAPAQPLPPQQQPQQQQQQQLVAAQVAAMHDTVSQLAGAQKEMAKQLALSVAAPVAKEGKRMEAAVSARVEKALKAHADALWARLQEDQARRERAEQARLQQAGAALSVTLAKEIAPAVERAVKKETAGIVRQLAPLLEASTIQAAASALQMLAPQMEKVVATTVESALSRHVAASVQATLKSSLQEAMRGCFEAAVVPAFQRACADMFQQVDASLQRGVAEHTSAAAAHFGSHNSAVSASLKEALGSVTAAAKVLQGEVLEGQRKLVALAEAAGASGGGATRTAAAAPAGAADAAAPVPAGHRHRQAHGQAPSDAAAAAAAKPAAVPDQLLSLEHVEAALDPTRELSRLVAERRYEEAFTRALQLSDVAIVWWLCQQVEREPLFAGGPEALSQGVVLSLVHQLSYDLSVDKLPKLLWLRSGTLCLNPSHPHVAPHARPVLEQVYGAVHAELAHAKPDAGPLAGELRLLIHILNSLLTACK